MDSRSIFLHLELGVINEAVTKKVRHSRLLDVLVQDSRWAGEANPSGCRKATSRVEYEDVSP